MASKFVRVFIFLLLGFSGMAQASFHLWRITEIYSNADGSVQFIELTALAGGQQFIAGHSITSTQPGAQGRTFTFPSNLPGDSATMSEDGGGYYGGGYTEYKSFLIGTQGFAALNVVRPDYTVSNGFLFTSNGTINFGEASDIVSYASLPTTGGLSINASGDATLTQFRAVVHTTSSLGDTSEPASLNPGLIGVTVPCEPATTSPLSESSEACGPARSLMRTTL